MKLEIEFLTNSKALIDLCTKYWKSDNGKKFSYTVAQISEEFEIPRTKLLYIINENCIVYSNEDPCINCGAPRSFRSRNDYLERKSYYRRFTWKCEDCIETEKEIEEQQRQLADSLRYDLINNELNIVKTDGIIDIKDFTFEQAIYLLSLIRFAGSEDLTFINPHDKIIQLLSPTIEFDGEILDSLYHDNLICIHPNSRPESVVIENNKFTRFYPFKVHWILPIPDNGPSVAKFVENLENAIKSDTWQETWREEADMLHRKVSFHECIQYMRVVLEDHGFDLKIGDKTKLVITNLLNNYSVAQAYNFIWRAAKDAAAFYVRENTTKSHAVNIVPGSIQRMSERAIAEGWEIRPYNRDFRAPQSIISEVLFNTALRLGERGFKEIPPKVES